MVATVVRYRLHRWLVVVMLGTLIVVSSFVAATAVCAEDSVDTVAGKVFSPVPPIGVEDNSNDPDPSTPAATPPPQPFFITRLGSAP